MDDVAYFLRRGFALLVLGVVIWTFVKYPDTWADIALTILGWLKQAALAVLTFFKAIIHAFR